MSSSSHISKTQSFKIETSVENALNYASFVVTMNTASQIAKPFYSQSSITIIKENLKLFAFQTSSSISLLKCENVTNWKHYSQIDFKEPSYQKLPIGHFEFLPNLSENLESYTKEMLIGYRNGLILHINFMDNNILNKFNQIDIEEGQKYISVQTILFSPKSSSSFYVLFSNNLLMHYLLEKTGENAEFIEEKNRIVDKRKATGKSKGKAVSSTNSFETKVHRFEGMSESNFISGRNLDKTAKNPTRFYFFDCPAISEAGFHQNNYFKQMGSETVFAFAGYDGFLRIYDLEQKKLLFSFKSNYGGFNNLSFSKNGELVALSGHDDNIVILNLSNYGYVTIEGHKSFISKVILRDLDEKNIRIYVGSMDGTISITDINTYEIGLKNSLDSLVDKKKGPIKIFFSDYKSRRIMAKNISHICNEGIGNIVVHEPHFLVAGYDGGVGVWVLQAESDIKNEKMSESENGGKQKKNKKKESDEEKIAEEKDEKSEEITKKKNNYMKEEISAGLVGDNNRRKKN